VQNAAFFWVPLIGSLARPLGGWMSDKVGGARITFWDFVDESPPNEMSS
jgi:NNP family nitrate/nitrite transporter-like MFS transporter